MSKPIGIWLEVSEIEFNSQFEETPGATPKTAIVARFKADRDEKDPTWWPIDYIQPAKASEEYNRFLKWLERDRILLGRLGINKDNKLRILGIRTQAPRDES